MEIVLIIMASVVTVIIAYLLTARMNQESEKAIRLHTEAKEKLKTVVNDMETIEYIGKFGCYCHRNLTGFIDDDIIELEKAVDCSKQKLVTYTQINRVRSPRYEKRRKQRKKNFNYD